MKKVYILMSIILYLVFGGILYKNYSMSNLEYNFNSSKINTILILFLLALKIIIDLLVFLKKHNKNFLKISYLYFFLILILFVKFMPSADNTDKLLLKNLKAMLKLNEIVFSKYDLKNDKLPSDEFFKSLERMNLGDTIYLKKGGKTYKYKIKLSFADNPKLKIEKGDAPGTFFIVVSKKNNDFYITASILDPKDKTTVMMGIDGETIVLNKNINKDEIIREKRRLETIREIFLNLKFK